uniref:Uncharacterized protein n=1 Tax=Anguilla anguilla TaxID=7936 RepID=A0A0E9TTS5_ANGAN
MQFRSLQQLRCSACASAPRSPQL